MTGPSDHLDGQLQLFLDAARRGDEDGFTGLYRLLGGKVAGYVSARGVDDRDDVTNEVFLGAFRNLGGFEGDASGFRSWLFGIAWHKSTDWHRAERRRPALIDDAEPVLAALVGGDAEEDSIDRMAGGEVHELLRVLTDDQRNVLLLRVVADLSLQEVADALGKPVGAVKSLQHRALARLEREIAPEAVSPSDQAANTRS